MKNIVNRSSVESAQRVVKVKNSQKVGQKDNSMSYINPS